MHKKAVTLQQTAHRNSIDGGWRNYGIQNSASIKRFVADKLSKLQ